MLSELATKIAPVIPLNIKPRSEPIQPVVFLTPNNIQEMLAKRSKLQMCKFRTTCSDPVPNF